MRCRQRSARLRVTNVALSVHAAAHGASSKRTARLSKPDWQPHAGGTAGSDARAWREPRGCVEASRHDPATANALAPAYTRLDAEDSARRAAAHGVAVVNEASEHFLVGIVSVDNDEETPSLRTEARSSSVPARTSRRFELRGTWPRRDLPWLVLLTLASMNRRRRSVSVL